MGKEPTKQVNKRDLKVLYHFRNNCDRGGFCSIKTNYQKKVLKVVDKRLKKVYYKHIKSNYSIF